MGGPLELPGGPPHRLVALTLQVGEGDGVGQLDQLGEHARLGVGKLPDSGLENLDPPGVGHRLARQLFQHCGQLRAGRQVRRPVDECCHPGHDSNIRSTPDRTGPS